MECKNHPSTPAADRCAGCAETFCAECLVRIHGQRYCRSCKVMTVKSAPMAEEGNLPCETAGKALTYSLVGIFCFGVVLGPMAISKAIEAKKELRSDPRLAGLAKANIALLLGIAELVLWAVGMIARVSK